MRDVISATSIPHQRLTWPARRVTHETDGTLFGRTERCRLVVRVALSGLRWRMVRVFAILDIGSRPEGNDLDGRRRWPFGYPQSPDVFCANTLVDDWIPNRNDTRVLAVG